MSSQYGEHYASLLIETSSEQYYDMLDSHRNAHFQLLKGFQVSPYVRELEGRQFVEVGEVAWFEPRPDKYYIYINDTQTCYLEDLVVRNNDSELREVFASIPWQEIADRMFIHDYNAKSGSDTNNIRSNIRWDAGFSGQNSTREHDGLEPLVFADRIMVTSKMSGCGGDTTLEHTMFKAGLAVMKVADASQKKHRDRQSQMSDKIFPYSPRHDIFSRWWARDLGLEAGNSQYCRFEGTSVFGTGETMDHRIKKTDRHVDKDNDAGRQYNHSPTLTKLVTVTFPNGQTRKVRI